jgi:hypothetical protein
MEDFYGEGLVGDSLDRIVDLSGTARTGSAAFSGSGRYFRNNSDGSSELSGRASASTTIAFADGELAATSAPGAALAILIPSSELRGQKVELRPINGVPTASASGRPTVVSGLTPYNDYIAQFELPASSPDARPNPSSVELSPEYRSIALIRVGLAPGHASIKWGDGSISSFNVPQSKAGDLVDIGLVLAKKSGSGGGVK